MTISVDTLPGEATEAGFFVMSLANSVLVRNDVNYLLDQIEAYGEHESLRMVIDEELVALNFADDPSRKLNFE